MAITRRAVTSNTTGGVYKYGRSDFSGTFDAGDYTQYDLNDTTAFTAGVPPYYHKVVAGDLVEMDAGEKAAVDTELELIAQQLYQGSAQITVQFPTEAALPSPTGGKGYIVGVANIGGTGPGLAISTNNNWYLFHNDGNT